MFNYEPYLKSLANFMADNGWTTRPFPKVILDDTDQGMDVLAKTGYFDPVSNGIRLFVHNRFPKDVLRTCAHEFIHWSQQNNGTLAKNGYKSDKIIDDDELIKLEAEAYLKGNIAFRSWTETIQKNGGLQKFQKNNAN